MSKIKKAATSALIIIIFTLISKILGFTRETLIAAKFGSGMETDSFIIALSATSLFSVMISRSINNTMIPVLSEVEAKEGKKGKIKHTNNLLNILLVISMLLIMIAWLFAPIVIKVMGSGFGGQQFNLTVSLMRIGLPVIFFSSIQGVLQGYLQSEMMFMESAISAVPFNFVYIFFLIFLSKHFGIVGLMVSSVVATFAQILIQVPGVRKLGFKYKLILDFKDKYVRKMIYLIPPILIGVAVSDLNKIIDKSLASTLAEGSISALNYATRIEGLTMGIFITSITTIIFPMLSEESNRKNYYGLKKMLIFGINIILLVSIPAAIGIIILSSPIVRVAFERGAFDLIATDMTVGALIFYTIGLPGIALRSLFTYVFYSLQDTKIPMINSTVSLVTNVIFNLVLMKFMQHKGLALATSISSIVTSLFLLYKLKQKIGPFGFLKSIKCGLKSLIASFIMGVVVYFLDKFINLGTGTLAELISLLISVGVGALVYFILIYLFKIEEVDWAINVAKDKLKKNKK